MRLFSSISVLVAACLAATTAGSAKAPFNRECGGTSRAFAFTSVTVLPMTAAEAVLRDRTVVVANGRISAVGPAALVQIPPEALRISGQGKYLMPGLADMHVHLEHFDSPEYLKLFLVNGVTNVRSMDGRQEILEAKRQIAAGVLTGPDIVTAGPVNDGSPPVRDDNVVLATPEEARRAVEQQAAAGYDFIKVYANLAPEVFRAIMETGAEHKIPVVGHVPKSVSLDEFLASGAKSIEHLGDFADAIAAPSAAEDSAPGFLKRRLGFRAEQSRIEALAAKVAKSRIWVVPTIIADDRLVAPPATVEEWARNPEATAVDRGILNGYWRGVLERAAERVGEGNWHWVGRGRANRLALLSALRSAGVPLLVGTDTPQPFVFPGSSVHDELANYVAAGFTPGEALAAATRKPARFLGQQQSWGTIEQGKRANLLLLDANPLLDITATRRIVGVAAGGRWMPAQCLRRMRQEVEQVAAASS